MPSLPPCHGEVMRLVVMPAHHEANKTEAANMLDFLRIGRGNGKELAIRQ